MTDRMSDSERDYDGIAKFRYTHAEDGVCEFTEEDEIHEDLEALVEEWRVEADRWSDHYSMSDNKAALGRCNTYALCADVLEKVLENQ